MNKSLKRKLVAIGLSLAMTLGTASAVSAASWTTYQGADNHNGTVTAAPTSIAANYPKTVSLPYSGNIWAGVDTEPVMETVNGTTYAYVIYNAGTYSYSGADEDEVVNGIYQGTGGARLAKINCSTGEATTVALSASSGFQLSTPYLDEANGQLYVAVTDFYNTLTGSELAGNVAANGTKATSFTFDQTLSTTKSQLTAGVKLASAGANASVYFTLESGGTTVWTSETYTVDSTEESPYIEDLFSNKLTNGTTYILKAHVSGAAVNIEYVNYSIQTSGIKKVNRELTSSVDVAHTTNGGQINTPLNVYNNKLYFGTYNGGNKYYQVNIASGNNFGATNVFTGLGSFYWAGAYSDGSNVYFGGDGGYLYCVPVDEFEQTVTENDGDIVIKLSSGSIEAGNVRSTIMADGSTLYFTSQGGYLWKYDTGSNALNYANIGSTSTSTPVISNNDVIYVGCYGANVQGVKAIAKSDFNGNVTEASTTADNAKWKVVYADDNSTSTDRVQASVVAYSTGGTDYVYFTTNVSGGAGYCYSFVPSTGAAAPVWNTASLTGNTFTLQGMASCDGYMVFGNDYNKVTIVK